MPRIIDEEGNLLGIVNVIDAMAVLLVFAVIAAGAALVLGGPGSESATLDRAEVEVQVEEPAWVIDALRNSEPMGEDIVKPYPDSNIRIEKELRPNPNESEYLNDDQPVYRATVTLNIEGGMENGAFQFRGEHLYVGKDIQLDFTKAVVDGKVRSIHPIPGETNEQ